MNRRKNHQHSRNPPLNRCLNPPLNWRSNPRPNPPLNWRSNPTRNLTPGRCPNLRLGQSWRRVANPWRRWAACRRRGHWQCHSQRHWRSRREEESQGQPEPRSCPLRLFLLPLLSPSVSIPLGLRQDARGDFAVYVGQSKVAAGVAIG